MIRKSISVSVYLLLLAVAAPAQDKFYTKSGKISFVSKGNIETIEANHKSVTCVLDTKSGNIQFAVLMKGFEFRKALMQEHFNENYVESNKYPQAMFKGQVVNNSNINYGKAGTYDAKVAGRLTIHGVTRDVETTGKITVKDNSLLSAATFSIQLSDYKIQIPGVVSENISNTVNIMVNCLLEPLNR